MNGLLHGVTHDVRDSWRSIAKAPGFSLGVIGSLALGLAAVTAAFSLVNAVALRPPAGVERPREIVELRVQRMISGIFQRVSTPDTLVQLRSAMKTLSDVAASRRVDMVVALPGEPLDVRAMVVSANYFDVLGVRPSAGRLFSGADRDSPGASATVVLSHDTWVRHFASDASIVGTPLKVNGRLLDVIGITPPGFTGVRVEIDEDSAPQVWVPLSMADLVTKTPPTLLLDLVGRLQPGRTRADAQTEASVMAPRFDDAGASQQGTRIVVMSSGPHGATSDLVSFMALPAIVLLLACVNAANLLTSRASRRARDAALRLSLGATKWRLMRQLLVESLLLALSAAALGVVATIGIVSAFEHYMPIDLHVDWRVLLFAIGIAVVTALGFGLAPAASAAARAGDLVTRLARHRRSHLRPILIALQAALSLGLIATGWQFANTVRVLAAADGLSAPERLAIASIDVGKLRWPDAEVDVYYDRLVNRVEQLPGVAAVSTSCECNVWGVWASIPGGGGVYLWGPQHTPDKPGNNLAMYAGGDFFDAMELRIASGRAFRADEFAAPVRALIVNQPFADRYLGASPVGQSLRVGATSDFNASRVAVVVGVVAPPTVRRTDSLPMIYYPAPLATMPARTLLVRYDRAALDRLPLLHAAIRELHPDVARPEIFTAEQLRWQRHSARQYLATGVSLLGVLALVLAAGGLYGVVSFMVTMRRHEIAVRLALGAEPRKVVRMIVRQALTPAGIGTVVGAAGAVAMGLIVRSRLYGSSLVDPVAFTGATALLLGVLLVASAIPARHAARIDPMAVLKDE